MPRTLTILTLLLATLLPLLYPRIKFLLSLESNHPSKLTRRGSVVETGNYGVKYANVVRNCEDVVLDTETGVAILACDEGRDGWNTVMGHFNTTPIPPNGRLYLHTYSATQPNLEEIRLLNLPSDYTFHPLGLSYHIPSNTLTIINHRLSHSSIDIFSFTRHGNSATYIRSLTSPYLPTPNSILHLSATEALVTNDHFFPRRTWPLFATLETYLALPLGGVVHVDLATGACTPLSRAAFANGIAMVGDRVAVASSSTGEVYLYALTRDVQGTPGLRLEETIRVGFIPDNLHADGETLLIAGHAHLRSFARFCAKRRACGGDTEREGCTGTSPTMAVEWRRETGLRELYVGDEINTGSSVVRDGKRGVGIISGLYGKGILVWNEKQDE